jgi:hypothetical protein
MPAAVYELGEPPAEAAAAEALAAAVSALCTCAPKPTASLPSRLYLVVTPSPCHRRTKRISDTSVARRCFPSAMTNDKAVELPLGFDTTFLAVEL